MMDDSIKRKGEPMDDDITFCINGWKECGLTRCERHPSNISDKSIPHSFAELYQTEYCPLEKPDGRKFKVIDTQTGKECDWQDLERFALHEDWAKGLMYCDMEQFAVGEDGSLYLLDECGKWVYPPEGRFEVKWMT